MKKLLVQLAPLFLLTIFLIPGITIHAQNTIEYTPLTGIYGITQDETGRVVGDLGTFLTNLFNLVVGVGGILAVIMLMWGGFEYMTSEAYGSKEAAKTRMWGAVSGLLFIFFSIIILNVINPDLLSLRLNIKKVDSIAPVSTDPTQTRTNTSYPADKYTLAWDSFVVAQQCWKQYSIVNATYELCTQQPQYTTITQSRAVTRINSLCEKGKILPSTSPDNFPFCR